MTSERCEFVIEDDSQFFEKEKKGLVTSHRAHEAPVSLTFDTTVFLLKIISCWKKLSSGVEVLGEAEADRPEMKVFANLTRKASL